MTGKKQDLYRIASQDYLLAVEDTIPPGAKEDFIHSEYVALPDQQRRIRGFYDAKKTQEGHTIVIKVTQKTK